VARSKRSSPPPFSSRARACRPGRRRRPVRRCARGSAGFAGREEEAGPPRSAGRAGSALPASVPIQRNPVPVFADRQTMLWLIEFRFPGSLRKWANFFFFTASLLSPRRTSRSRGSRIGPRGGTRTRSVLRLRGPSGSFRPALQTAPVARSSRASPPPSVPIQREPEGPSKRARIRSLGMRAGTCGAVPAETAGRPVE